MLTCCFSVAIGEWIPFITQVTLADGVVVVDRAGGVCATNSGTRILTLLSDASQVGRTLLVDRALWLALNVRVSLKTRQTRTGRRLVSFIAHSVGATRRRVARINDLWPPSGG